MPLKPLQFEVARLLRANRSPSSHLAGGALINRRSDSLRFTADLDYFQDAPELIAVCAERDVEFLSKAGIEIRWEFKRATHWRAAAWKGGETLLLDWSQDSAFRFFPAVADEEFGYTLHAADVATNKVLALVGRAEIRDFLDVLELHRTSLSFGAMIWAACGKDPGYSPQMMLDMTNRHSRYQPDELHSQQLTRPVDLVDLKRQWLAARVEAEALFERLPEIHLGCLYVDASGNPVTPNPDAPSFKDLLPHFGQPFGSWPKR